MFYASEDAVRLIEMTPLKGDGHVTEGLQSVVEGKGGEGRCEGKEGVWLQVRIRVREKVRARGEECGT